MAHLIRISALLAALALASAPTSAQAQSDDDDEGPAKPATPAPASPPAAAPGTTAPATDTTKPGVAPADSKAAPKPALKAAVKTSADLKEKDEEDKPTAEELRPKARPAPAPVSIDQGYLEGRADVESPNEAIHTVEKKTYTAANRFEASVFGAAQLNSKFTNTDGLAVAVSYAVQENFSLQVLGLYNPIGGWASLTGTLLDLKARPLAADQIYLQGGALAGFEVSPLYGKFSFYQGTLAQFRFVLNAGAGIGFTEVQLTKPTSKNPDNAASYGNTGPHFLGDLGAGFRVLLSERFALRLEVRDLLYTAKVDTIDGCNASDLGSINGMSGSSAAVSSGCNQSNFTGGSDPKVINQHQNARNVAMNLLQDNSSDVVNDVIFLAGLSYLF